MRTQIESISKSVWGNSYWYRVRVGEWLAQAQVFGLPSQYGIGARDNDGNWLCDPENMPVSARISRLGINTYTDGKIGEQVYWFERGLDFDNTPAGLLQTVIDAVLKFAK